MIQIIPFYENNGDGNQCMQVAMKCVLKHFLNKEFSLDELDNLTGRKENLWTFTSQVASTLYDLGLDVKLYSKEDLEPFLGGEPFFRKHYGKDADKILQYTDVPTVVKSTQTLISKNIFEKRILSLGEILNNLSKDYIPMVLIDYNKITRKDGFYQGHFVVVTGFDKEYIYFHESGPNDSEPNKKVKKEFFEEAINANGTDNDCVIVYGIRH